MKLHIRLDILDTLIRLMNDKKVMYDVINIAYFMKPFEQISN